MLRNLIVAGLAGISCLPLASQPLPERKPIQWRSPVKDKNFYVLSLLDESPQLRRALSADPSLRDMLQQHRRRFTGALAACGENLSCIGAQLRFTPEEIDTAASSFAAAYDDNPALRNFVNGPLTASGMYQRLAERYEARLLASAAWKSAANGINSVINVYLGLVAPLHPATDSPLEKAEPAWYRKMVVLALKVLQDEPNFPNTFYDLPLRFALMLLDLNGRDEPARWEPLEHGENRAALERSRTVRWGDYPYSAILALGASGPTRRLRVMLAARRFREAKAPFLVVSGGAPHPARTPDSEAIAMKKQLMGEGIPENAILIEPQARHTTTNIRNSVRQIYRYGFPFDRGILITTDPDQSTNIESAAFSDRCLKELGYLPMSVQQRLSAFDLVVLPRTVALQSDPSDPLDP